jgi:hypothetical protein
VTVICLPTETSSPETELVFTLAQAGRPASSISNVDITRLTQFGVIVPLVVPVILILFFP